MDAGQLLVAAQAMYEAYWFYLGGILDGVKLPCWNDLEQNQIDSLIVGVQAVETYINSLGG